VRGDDCCLLEWDLRVARLGHNFVGLSHSTCYLLGVLAGWASFCWEPKIRNAARDVYGKTGSTKKGRGRILTDLVLIPNSQ
jgi:hypothetical protein